MIAFIKFPFINDYHSYMVLNFYIFKSLFKENRRFFDTFCACRAQNKMSLVDNVGPRFIHVIFSTIKSGKLY